MPIQLTWSIMVIVNVVVVSRGTSHSSRSTLQGIKNTPIFFHHILKKSDPIAIHFSKNIPDTTGHQMTV